MTEDSVQLRQFVEDANEVAFGQLVSRHFNLVDLSPKETDGPWPNLYAGAE